MRLGCAPAPRRGPRCSSLSRCSTIGSAYTQLWATAPQRRPAPAWRRSPCALRRDILIYPLHTKGGGPNLEVRLGAIYALERIPRDSERDHWPIMEVLCAYVRNPE